MATNTDLFISCVFLFTAAGCQDLKYIFLNSMAIKGKNSLKVSALIQLAKFNLYCQDTVRSSTTARLSLPSLSLSLSFLRTHIYEFVPR